MKKQIFLIVLIMLSALTNAQNMKTYDGPFTIESADVVGTAKYSYYENENYERIYNGNFSFSWKLGTNTLEINGKYDNDFRNGLWVFKTYLSDSEASLIVTANYKNGEPDGIWTSSLTSTKVKGIAVTDKRVFSKGRLIDTWNYDNQERKNKLTMKLDTAGFILESDYIELGKIETIKKYKVGYCTLDVTKNMQSGSSDVKKVEDIETLSNLSKIEQYIKSNSDSIQDLPIKLQRVTKENMWNKFFYDPYGFTFTDDIHGAFVYNGKQFYGIFENEIVKQETRAQKRLLEEEKIANAKLLEEKKIADAKIAEEKKIAEAKRIEEYKILYEKKSNLTEKTAELIALISEQKDKMIFKPKVYIKIDEFKEYSSTLNQDVLYYKGLVPKKNFDNIYISYNILMNNISTNNSAITITSLEKQYEITDKFISLSKSEDSKDINKKLNDITDVEVIKKIVNIN